MTFELEHIFNSYEKNGKIYYGGSQMLSPDKMFRKCGCGIVAAADLFLYLHRYHKGCRCSMFDCFKEEIISVDKFLPLYKSLRSYFTLIPHLGISGIMLALGINAFFLHNKYPYYARWGVLPSRLWSSIEEMLRQDIPVLITVGPDFPRIWEKHSTNMYSDSAAGHSRSTKVRAHFMTLTALDEEWMHVSSWGKKYRISRDEYEFHMKHHASAVSSNIVYISRLEKAP